MNKKFSILIIYPHLPLPGRYGNKHSACLSDVNVLMIVTVVSDVRLGCKDGYVLPLVPLNQNKVDTDISPYAGAEVAGGVTLQYINTSIT